jgi:3-methyladenine DNA glycosylase/8-oxoguanine DNA glycosylase
MRLAWPIDLALTVASHGWVELAPWQWDAAAGRLGRRERIGATLGTVAVRQETPDLLIVCCDGFTVDQTDAAVRRVGRWVSAEWDPAPALAALRPDLAVEAALVERGGGRLLRGSSFFEDFVKTVLTINTTWSATCRMTAAIVAEPGEGAFPAPAAIIEYGEARLRERAKLGFRAPTVIAATRRMLDDGVINAEGDGPADRLDHDYLTGLKGIGPYAAAHCRMLLHDFSRLPIDTVLTAFVRERYGLDPTAFAESRGASGAYLALGYRLSRLNLKLAAIGKPPP